MGLSVIADAMQGRSEGETYAGIGCGVMIIGLIGVVGSPMIAWYKRGE